MTDQENNTGAGSSEQTVFYTDGELVIRAMEEADAQVFTDEELAQGWHTEVSKFLEKMKDRDVGRCVSLTAEFKGHPAGYIHVYLQAREGPFAKRGWPVIVDFGVLEKYRRMGIGRRLMDEAEKIASRYADTVCLAVGLHEGYGSAQRMYIRRGYIPDGTGAWYHGKPCTPYSDYPVDDDLVLHLYKRLSG